MYIAAAKPTGLALVLWISLAALFVHQFEEYRCPGYFPGFINTVFFSSKQPERYPLNTNSAVAVNLGTGWLAYFLAAALNYQALWLGIAVTMIPIGNIIVHTVVFNIKGKTVYSPGMASAIVLFLHLSAYFFYLAISSNAVSLLDMGVGLGLGVALFYVGVDKLVDWLKNENTSYAFPARCLIPVKRRLPGRPC